MKGHTEYACATNKAKSGKDGRSGEESALRVAGGNRVCETKPIRHAWRRDRSAASGAVWRPLALALIAGTDRRHGSNVVRTGGRTHGKPAGKFIGVIGPKRVEQSQEHHWLALCGRPNRPCPETDGVER
jgi:hypothetical protein